MFTPDALTQLSESNSINAVATAAKDALSAKGNAIIALPSDYKAHDLERYLPTRRRARGAYRTSRITDFAKYADEHKEAGASVFVDPSDMSAEAVLNLGTPKAPGHADNTALFKPARTAAYSALLGMTSGSAHYQQTVAEWMEDWAEHLSFANADGALDASKAIGAIRNITVEGVKRVEAKEEQLSASRSAFESVKASSVDPIPTMLVFKCIPYQDFNVREFLLRLSIRTGDKPTIVLRQVNEELHTEAMAAELCEMAASHVKDLPVLVGDYKTK